MNGEAIYNLKLDLLIMHSTTKRIVALFDVDQTLTPARSSIQKAMIDTLDACIAKGIAVGIVSGSDLVKIKEQVGDELVQKADFTFSENGLYSLKKG
jgi:phosphomannomutase